jgi:hypothetical protein
MQYHTAATLSTRAAASTSRFHDGYDPQVTLLWPDHLRHDQFLDRLCRGRVSRRRTLEILGAPIIPIEWRDIADFAVPLADSAKRGDETATGLRKE